MNKISFGQLAPLILITDVFGLICLTGEINSSTLLGFICGALVQLILVLPSAFSIKIGKSMGMGVKYIFLGYIIIFGGFLFRTLWNASDALSVPSENFGRISDKYIITGTIILMCIYVSGLGIKAISRAGLIAGVLGIICMIIIIFGAWSEWDRSEVNLSGASENFLSEFSRSFCTGGGIISGIILLGYSHEKSLKYAVGLTAARILIYTVTIMVTMAVSGGISGISEFPVILSAQLSQPFSSQRVDSLFLIIFAVMAVFSTAVQAVCSAKLWNELFPKFSRFSALFVLILMTLSALIFKNYGIWFPIISGIIPLLAVFGGRKKA